MSSINQSELLERVEAALTVASAVFSRFDNRRVEELEKAGGDPVTEVDLILDRSLREVLQQDGDGWLSEETADDMSRMDSELVWVVDPLDGTREFIDGLPEFCTSIAAVVDGVPVAGGIANPAAGIRVVGSVGAGLSCNSIPVQPARLLPLTETRVLASRSEVSRGQWEVVEKAGIAVEPMGSVAYKMARVAAGLNGATWTPVPKHEWDVAGGTALLRAIGGTTVGLDGHEIRFNQENPWMEGAIAFPPGFQDHLPDVLDLVDRQTSSE